MNRALDVLSNLMLASFLLIVFGAFLAPHLLGVTLHTIVSESMAPQIDVGDVVALDGTVPAEAIEVGDVIAFEVEGIDLPVTHRVSAIVEDAGQIAFHTEGDALEEADPWTIRPEQILGKVVLRIPRLGYLTSIIRTRYGFALLILLPGLMIVALETKDLVAQPRKRKQEMMGSSRPDRAAAHLWLLACVAITGTIWGLVTSNMQTRELGDFALQHESPGHLVFRRNIRNDAPFPLIVCLCSDGVTFSESYFLLPPGATQSIEMVGSSEEAVVRTGGLPPVVPARLLHRLFAWNPQAAVVLTALIPGLALAVSGFTILGGFSSEKAYRRKRVKTLRNLGHT